MTSVHSDVPIVTLHTRPHDVDDGAGSARKLACGISATSPARSDFGSVRPSDFAPAHCVQMEARTPPPLENVLTATDTFGGAGRGFALDLIHRGGPFVKRKKAHHEVREAEEITSASHG